MLKDWSLFNKTIPTVYKYLHSSFLSRPSFNFGKFPCSRSNLLKQIRPCLLFFFFYQLFYLSQWCTWLFFSRMCNDLCQKNRIGCRQREVWMESAVWIWVWSAEMSCWAPSRAERYLQRGWRQRCRQVSAGTTDHHTHTHTRRPHAHTHIVEISIKIWSCCVLCFAIISLFTLAVMQKKGKDSLLGFWSLKQHYAEIGIFFLQFGDPAPTDGRIVYPEVKLNRNRWTLYEFHQLNFFNFDVFWWTTVNYSYSLINVRTTGCIR